MEGLVWSLVEAVGGELVSQIAEGLVNGMEPEFLKTNEDKLMEELKVLQTKIDDLGKSAIEAIRKQKITSAADRVRNCFKRLREAARETTWDSQRLGSKCAISEAVVCLPRSSPRKHMMYEKREVMVIGRTRNTLGEGKG
jgi:hypothetical protein